MSHYCFCQSFCLLSKYRICQEVTLLIITTNIPESNEQQTASTSSLWAAFDRKVAESSCCRRSSTVDSMIEVQRYFEEVNIKHTSMAYVFECIIT